MRGHIIEFLDSDRLRPGLVVSVDDRKVLVADAKNRRHRIQRRQIALVHPETPPQDGFGRALNTMMAAISSAARELDLSLLWEAVAEPPEARDIEALAAEYFGDCTTAQKSALLRGLFADTVHFHRRGLLFTPRTRAEMAERQAADERRAAREAWRQQAVDWLRDTLALASTGVRVPDTLSALPTAIASYLDGTSPSDETEKLLKEAAGGLPPREAAVQVLQRADALPTDWDPWLTIAGVCEHAPDAADHVSPYSAEPQRRHFVDQPVIAIDAPDTREVDDAFSLTLNDDGSAELAIHIADVAAFVERHSPLDDCAHERGTTIYLPTAVAPMFPPRLAYDLASLQPGSDRPAVTYLVDFNADASIRGHQILRSNVRISQRMSYEEADAAIVDTTAADHQLLARAAALADALRRQRIAAGALILQRPDIKYEVAGDNVDLQSVDANSPSRRMVGEMMVLANHLTAEHARGNRVPLIYRTQAPGDERRSGDIPYDPAQMPSILRQLGRVRLSTHAQRHATLGLTSYTQATSPIRRYADLVAQRQLVASIADDTPPYSTAELMEVIAAVEDAEGTARELEGRAKRYWQLVYMAGARETTWRATVVNRNQRGFLVELERLPIRGLLRASGRFESGDTVAVRVRHVEPTRNEFTLELA
jgi:exoribonuclease-2